MDLYHKEKYKVVEGIPSSVALCTCWNDPFMIANKYPEVRKLFALTGSLYSREGVSILLRNLALNPSIHTVLIWGNGKLSQTAIGSKGKNMLLRLWDAGRGPDQDMLQEIQKEIDEIVLELILQKVSFIDLSEMNFTQVLEFTRSLEVKQTTYMSPVQFPDPVREEDEPFPSEQTNFSVRGKTIPEAWVKALDRIVRYGSWKESQSGQKQKELISVSWTIESADISQIEQVDWPPQIKERIGIEEGILKQYASIFLDKEKPSDVTYTYGNRLRQYRDKIDQIQYLVDTINESRVTRHAYAVTYDPEIDSTNVSPPCLTSIQALVSPDDKLHMIAYFRSHDIFKAALPNAYGLIHVLEYIAAETDMKPGTLTIHSISAHVYEDDIRDATLLLKCAFWERLKLYFDEQEDLDPRGIARIEVQGKKLYCALSDETGATLHEYRGNSAREVALHFARLGLLSRNEHLVDISIELTKAEVSYKLGKTYIQDKPLVIDTAVVK